MVPGGGRVTEKGERMEETLPSGLPRVVSGWIHVVPLLMPSCS